MGRSFHADEPTTEKALLCSVTKWVRRKKHFHNYFHLASILVNSIPTKANTSIYVIQIIDIPDNLDLGNLSSANYVFD